MTCKHGAAGACDLCQAEDDEHDRVMAGAALHDRVERLALAAGFDFVDGDILRLRRYDGEPDDAPTTSHDAGDCSRQLERFAALVAEECAKECELRWEIDGTEAAKEFGAAIRNRFGLKPSS